MWNGVHFDTNTVVPAWAMILYALLALVLFAYGWRKHLLSKLSTVDFVYVGLLSSLLVIWNFFLAPLIPSVTALTSWFYYPDIGEVVILLLVAALIGKPGSVTVTVVVYDLLSDMFHYGFGGEPFWLIQEILAKAVLLDLYLLLRGRFFATNVLGTKAGSKGELRLRTVPGLFLVDSVIGGLVVALDYPVFYRGFFATFVEGISYTSNYVLVTSLVSIAGGVIMGLLAAPLVVYVRKALTGTF